MKSFSILVSIFCCLAVVLSTFQPVKSCPSIEEIRPCWCSSDLTGKIIHCLGPLITQDAIQNVFDVMSRRDAAAATKVQLSLQGFRINGTLMTGLDLTPFTHKTIKNLWINHNSELTQLTGPLLESFSGTIASETIVIGNNGKLTDAGLGNTLKYFSPELLTAAYLADNLLTGAPSIGEFLPGLNALTQLTSLSLEGNNITKLLGAPFYYNSKLTYLALGSNQIDEISTPGFLFDRVLANGRKLDLYLARNNFTSEVFSTSTWLNTINRNVYLVMSINQVNTLARSVFEPFLSNDKNNIVPYNNPLVCDENVKWLKDNRTFYEPRVSGAYCINDPGQTVFNSTLIP